MVLLSHHIFSDINVSGWRWVARTSVEEEKNQIKSGSVIGETIFVWADVIKKSKYDEVIILEIDCPLINVKQRLYDNQEIEGREAWCSEKYFIDTDKLYLIEGIKTLI